MSFYDVILQYEIGACDETGGDLADSIPVLESKTVLRLLNHTVTIIVYVMLMRNKNVKSNVTPKFKQWNP